MEGAGGESTATNSSTEGGGVGGGCGGGSQVSREGMDRERAEERMMEGGCGLRGVGGSEGTWEGSEPRSRRR